MLGCGGSSTHSPLDVAPSSPPSVDTPAEENPETDLAPPASFRLEAESFDGYSDTTPSNKGGAGDPNIGVDLEATSDIGAGLNLSWTEQGEWLEYTIDVPETAEYLVTARLAAEASGGQFHLLIDGERRTTVSIFGTGGWQSWMDQKVSLGTITQGRHNVKLEITKGLFNLNYLDFAPGKLNSLLAEIGPDSFTAQVAVQQMGNGFNIGQVFETENGSAREFAPVRKKIDAYYALGYRHVRLPVTWSMPIDGRPLVDSETGELDPEHPRFKVIADVINYALSLPDLIVIINAHHEIPIKHNNQWWILARLWRDVAEYFQGVDRRLIFELLNEPHNADGLAMPPFDLRNMSRLAYQNIRAIDPSRIVVISGNQWGAASELARTWPDLNGVGNGLDAYLMATFHHYDPWLEFHSEDTSSRDYPFTESTLVSPLETADQWRRGLGVELPIYIGEWGVGWGKLEPTMDCNNLRFWYQQLPFVAEEFSMPTTVWDDGGWFAIFRYETGQFINNLAQCITGECEWQGVERFNEACR